ncbi:MAG: hypothetical protein RSB76_01600 [Clostridia bacterium]
MASCEKEKYDAVQVSEKAKVLCQTSLEFGEDATITPDIFNEISNSDVLLLGNDLAIHLEILSDIEESKRVEMLFENDGKCIEILDDDIIAFISVANLSNVLMSVCMEFDLVITAADGSVTRVKTKTLPILVEPNCLVQQVQKINKALNNYLTIKVEKFELITSN